MSLETLILGTQLSCYKKPNHAWVAQPRTPACGQLATNIVARHVDQGTNHSLWPSGDSRPGHHLIATASEPAREDGGAKPHRRSTMEENKGVLFCATKLSFRCLVR